MAKTIDEYKKDWQLAHDAGDKAGMDAAHAAAEALRAKAGFSGGVDGSEYIPLDTTPGAPSGFQGSATGVNTFTNAQKSIQEQMNENSKQWWVADAAGREALHAKNEELSKLLGGGVAYDPSSGTWSGNAAPVSETSTQIDSLLNAILNREPFSYDHTTDPTYLAYEDKYKRLGDRAREDTLGDVAGLTGGLPSSWAVSAASQAQNDYNQQLSDVIPTLYDAAYNRYLNEDSLKRSDLGLIMDVDNMKYGRERDKVADNKWEQEFGLSKDQFDWNKYTWGEEFDLSKDKFDWSKDVDSFNMDIAASDQLMSKWKTMGVADEEVAKGLGVPVGSTTESYYFNKADQELAKAKWDKESAEADQADYSAQKSRELLVNRALSIINNAAYNPEKKHEDAAEIILAEAGGYGIGMEDYFAICKEAGIPDDVANTVYSQYVSEYLESENESENETEENPYLYYASQMGAAEDPAAWFEQNKWLIGDPDIVDYLSKLLNDY